MGTAQWTIPGHVPVRIDEAVPASRAPAVTVHADHIEDSLLIAQARQRNLDAFEELVRRHYGTVYRIAFRLLGDVVDAEDATQEAFERAWKGISRFRGGCSFVTWIYRIVTNVCLTALRLRGRVVPLDYARETTDSPEERPDRMAEDTACRSALTQAIMELTPEQRAPLMLREFADCSYEEIGAILGLSEPAVRGRLHRARHVLAEVMQPWR